MVTRRNTRIYNANRFKLGLFAPNCSNGLAITTVSERWDASWDNNVALARRSEALGLEFLLPIARWHGYDGEKVSTQNETLETITWATGVLAHTEEICVFGTVHAPLINPVFAAKQIATADHVGRGRLGLNVVAGWNQAEFDMFGVGLREHDDRYGYAEEWLTVVTRIWTEERPFDHDGRYLALKGVIGAPKPCFGETPLLMSAGSSEAGRAFAARNADCLFMLIVDDDKLGPEIAAIRALAGGRDVGVYASGHVVTRPTQKEAEDYYVYYAEEMADAAGVDYLMEGRKNTRSLPPELMPQMRRRLASGLGTFPIVGSPDHVADTFDKLSRAGLDGMAFGLVNYLDELPFFAGEVLPRMERLGLRAPHRVAA